MGRVSRATRDAHRTDLIDAAGRLFREKGLDGVGVGEIARAAGLTHGAIYSGFESKSELAAVAFTAGRTASRERTSDRLGISPTLAMILDHYVSKRQRDDRVSCCPLVASASEAARQDVAYRSAFTAAFLEIAETVQSAIEMESASDARRKSLAITAGMIGAVAIARALDENASDELLDAARAVFSGPADL
jgi:TetR/AcrR family transcriptional repressor of nem operon